MNTVVDSTRHERHLVELVADQVFVVDLYGGQEGISDPLPEDHEVYRGGIQRGHQERRGRLETLSQIVSVEHGTCVEANLVHLGDTFGVVPDRLLDRSRQLVARRATGDVGGDRNGQRVVRTRHRFSPSVVSIPISGFEHILPYNKYKAVSIDVYVSSKMKLEKE